MSDFFKSLKIGDKFLVENNMSKHIVSVKRITPTGIIIDTSGTKYRNGRSIGTSVWNHSYIHELTEDVKKELFELRIKRYVTEFNYHNLTTEQSIKVYNLLKDFKNTDGN